MISDFGVDEFRKRLLQICEVKLPPVRFMRSPTSSSKPYVGKITDESFELRKNAAAFATTFYIVGDYKPDGGKTEVYFGLKRLRFEYYFLRVAPFVFALLVDAALYNNISFVKLVALNLIVVALFVILTILDSYFGKRMAKDFIEKMKITV